MHLHRYLNLRLGRNSRGSMRISSWVVILLAAFCLTVLASFISSNFVCCVDPIQQWDKASVVGSYIQSALASYAANDPKNQYPPVAMITGYTQLRSVLERNDISPPDESWFGKFIHYGASDKDEDELRDAYSVRLGYWRDAQQKDMMVYVLITPSGVLRCSDHKTDSCSN